VLLLHVKYFLPGRYPVNETGNLPQTTKLHITTLERSSSDCWIRLYSSPFNKTLVV